MSKAAWKLDQKYGAAYLEDKSLVMEILGLAGKHSKLDKAVMATYVSPGGRSIAWQIRFDMKNWEHISGTLGLQSYERIPTLLPKERAVKQKTVKTRAVPQRGRKKRT